MHPILFRQHAKGWGSSITYVTGAGGFPQKFLRHLRVLSFSLHHNLESLTVSQMLRHPERPLFRFEPRIGYPVFFLLLAGGDECVSARLLRCGKGERNNHAKTFSGLVLRHGA